MILLPIRDYTGSVEWLWVNPDGITSCIIETDTVDIHLAPGYEVDGADWLLIDMPYEKLVKTMLLTGHRGWE